MDKCRECPADRDEAVCGLKFYRYWRGETVSAHAGFWWDAPQDCSLTPAAMRLVKMLIEHGISDEDAELVAKAIAGEGRLDCLSSDRRRAIKHALTNDGTYIPGFNFSRQDQGGE